MAIASPAPQRGLAIPLESRAASNLQFIRDAMERAGSFTAVPGWGGVAIGITALAAGLIAHRATSIQQQSLEWIFEGVLALAIGIAALLVKARRLALPLSSRTAQRTFMSFGAPIIAGSLLTVALYRIDQLAILPGLWLLLYGVAVICAGAFSVRIVPAMGVCFLLFGTAALCFPASGNLCMTAGFGLLHIVFGYAIARRHGG